eukprot:6398028-Prymnesium_polylepis.1
MQLPQRCSHSGGEAMLRPPNHRDERLNWLAQRPVVHEEGLGAATSIVSVISCAARRAPASR